MLSAISFALIHHMFKNLRATENKNLNNSGRSHFGETLQLEGDLRSSGSIDVAGLINGNVFVSEMTVAETGSVRGSVEAGSIEINVHIEGKITADAVIVGKNAVIKGDIFFKSTLKTEEGAEIDGHIKGNKSGRNFEAEEDSDIEKITERPELGKPTLVKDNKKEAV